MKLDQPSNEGNLDFLQIYHFSLFNMSQNDSTLLDILLVLQVYEFKICLMKELFTLFIDDY
jgi:hypothetical protein